MALWSLTKGPIHGHTSLHLQYGLRPSSSSPTPPFLSSPTICPHRLTSRKFKVARGGGRHFSRDLDPRRAQPDVVESSSEEESSEEEEDDEVEVKLAPEMAALNLKLGNTVAVDEEEEEEMSRAERKALRKKQADEAAKKKAAEPVKPVQEESEEEEESEDELLNPFQAKKAEPSRRER